MPVIDGTDILNWNLNKLNIVLVDWCCMCKYIDEMVDHLLIQC
jgi:hypothetical protein